MHLYCLSLGKQLSPEETSYAPVCINKPTHQAYFTRQNSPPKHRWGDQTVGFPTRRPKRLCFIVVESQNIFTAVFQPSAIIHLVGVPWFAFIQKVVLGQGHSFFTSNLQSAWHAFGERMEVEDKVHPTKGVLEEAHQKSGGSQAVGAHHPPEQTPLNSLN